MEFGVSIGVIVLCAFIRNLCRTRQRHIGKKGDAASKSKSRGRPAPIENRAVVGGRAMSKKSDTAICADGRGTQVGDRGVIGGYVASVEEGGSGSARALHGGGVGDRRVVGTC